MPPPSPLREAASALRQKVFVSRAKVQEADVLGYGVEDTSIEGLEGIQQAPLSCHVFQANVSAELPFNLEYG